MLTALLHLLLSVQISKSYSLKQLLGIRVKAGNFEYGAQKYKVSFIIIQCLVARNTKAVSMVNCTSGTSMVN